MEKLTENISCENVLVMCKALLLSQYKDMTDDTNSEVKEKATLLWNKIVKKLENEPELWSKVQESYSHARAAHELEQRKKLKKRKAFDFGVKPKKMRKE